ncbi:hypothetical protein PISMIDRAFT_5836 [Pisolithus microcarpus 441]|uniref:Uncharacterized protein n=1 Tax=Pisolithus microcarpus 441 TaxID=765257 RepID=A0A0C9Z1H0_9AGAM|nr:hypothetical protein PISMIDRAFT_5836 [Pisolithus microcarpus 441]
MASVGDAPSNHELLASLANVKTSLCMSSVAAPPSAPMVAMPMLPPITSPPAVAALGALNKQDIPMDDTMTPSVDHLTVTILLDDPHLTVTPPSPTPPYPSSTSTLTPSSSPIHSLPPHDAAPDQDELTEPSPRGTPPSATVLMIPVDSPLVSQAQLVDSRSGSHLNTEMEWRAFEPNWHLQLVPHNLKDSSSPASNETPLPSSSTIHLPLTSRMSSSTDDSALAIALAIRDVVVAAIEAFNQALEEQGLSSKAQGKH